MVEFCHIELHQSLKPFIGFTEKFICNITYTRLYYETAWLNIGITAQFKVGSQLSHETEGSGWDLFVVLYLVSFSSFCWLLFYLFTYNCLGSLCLFLLCSNSSLVGGLLHVCIVFAFLVKMPMFIVHLWLPKAHVEAPVSGSVILADIFLKLGCYGLLRLFPVLFKFSLYFV